jgi:hypothetical protein
MSLQQNGTKVAVGIVESLKNQPLTLAILVLNVLFLILFGYVMREVNLRNERMDLQRETIIRELTRTCDAVRYRLEELQRGR